MFKSLNFLGPIEGIRSTWHPQFVPARVLPDIFNRSNFEYSAFSSLKADSWKRRKKKVRKKMKKQKNSIHSLG